MALRTKLLALGVLVFSLPAIGAKADTQLEVGPSIGLTDQSPDGDRSAKIKIVRLSNGTLVVAYGDAGTEEFVYDVKERSERPARDVFVRRCNSNASDCSELSSWSTPTNLSNTAGQSSAATEWRGPDAGRLPFYGDSEKPNLFSNGSGVVVTWVDKFCDSSVQGSITYVELDQREIPFSCVYVSRSIDHGATWSAPRRLTTGLRDAKQDVNRGNDKAWVIVWQEDPGGLQLGEAEGPGDGGSGAKVNKGTDVWYSYLARADFNAEAEFPVPIRLTNNFIQMDSGKDANPNQESGKEGASRANVALVGMTVNLAYEETKGLEGLDDGKYVRFSSFRFDRPPTSCRVEEGTGGTGGLDGAGGAAGSGGSGGSAGAAGMAGASGAAGTDGTAGASGMGGVGPIDGQAGMGGEPAAPTLMMSAEVDEEGCLLSPNGDPYPDPTDPARVGCILSVPSENARRARLFGQGTPGPNSGAKLFVFWKQGEYDKGGPSDIVGRAATGFTVADFVQPVNVPTATEPGDELDGCYVRGAEESPATGAFANSLPINLSAETESGGDIDAETGDNEFEDSRAHRGFISGDLIILGYMYTPDWAVARHTDAENYEFWIRRSTDGGQSWSEPVDVSSDSTFELASRLGLSPTGVNVREPRIVKTPGKGPGCPSGDVDDATTTRPSDCRDPKTFVVAWGTETNVYEHLGPGQDLDIFITRSTDKGVTYEPYQLLAGGQSPSFNELDEMESQLRVTPDGKTVFSVWNEHGEETGTNGRFAISVETEIPVEPDPDPDPDNPDDTQASMTTAGCSVRTIGAAEYAQSVLFLLLALVVARRSCQAGRIGPPGKSFRVARSRAALGNVTGNGGRP